MSASTSRLALRRCAELRREEAHTMEFFMKLPHSKKEFALFVAIVSIISVNIIAPLITFFETSFTLQAWESTLRVLPLIWIAVVFLVLATKMPAERMAGKITAKNDSFNSKITITILCNVFFMSIFMTVIGAWIGQQGISMTAVTGFFYKWPRNFAISFAIEALIAQPIARSVLFAKHKHADAALAAADTATGL
jgi:hypothetical protein